MSEFEFNPIDEKALLTESFGREIYRRGILQVNPNTYLDDMIASYHITDKKQEESTRSTFGDRVPWIKKFNGKVPARWEDGRHICYDLERADILGIRLGDSLLTAAVSYPLWHVPLSAGEHQRLNSHQLEIAYSHVAPSSWEEITQGQLRKGVDQELLSRVRRRIYPKWNSRIERYLTKGGKI